MKEFEPIKKKDSSLSDDPIELSSLLYSTLIIPPEVYNNLPEPLLSICKLFKGDRERDVFLTGAIAVFSGCFPTITGLYDGVTVGANINCFIVAPAASGKGSLRWAKELGMLYHISLLEENKVELLKYESELEKYNKNKKDGEPDNAKPVQPPLKLLFIPANNSSSSLLQSLQDCGGRGVIFESEADTLANTLGQDWGNYSDIARKSFHHECVSLQRKAGKEYIEIRRPCLSIVLSGTPMQLRKLIPSAEDGLFSRFIYYGFNEKPYWRDVSPFNGNQSIEQHFDRLSEEVKRMILFFEKEANLLFELKPQQWQKLNSTFEKWLKEINLLVSADAVSIIKRLGLVTFRIAMILSVLRKHATGKIPINLECEDIDFQSALTLVEIYKEHAITIFNSLPKNGSIKLDLNKKKFYDALPNTFSRNESLPIAEKLEIAERTADKYLSEFTEYKLLTKVKYGVYVKNQ